MSKSKMEKAAVCPRFPLSAMLSAWWLVSAMGCPGQATGQDARTDRQPRIEVEVEALLLEVSVWDGEGFTVEGLSQDDFVVRQDGHERPILSLVRQPSTPLSLAVLIDCGSSAREDDLRLAKELVFQLIHRLDHEDEIVLATYRDEPRFHTQLTSERTVLVEALNNIGVGARPSRLDFLKGGGPSAGDAGITIAFNNTDSHTGLAVDQSLRRLRQARHDRTAVLVLSPSFGGLGQATLDHLERDGARFFAVRLKDKLGWLVSLGGDRSTQRRLSDATSGTTVSGEKVLSRLETLRDGLKSSYWLGVEPSDREGLLEVRVRDRNHLKVTLRRLREAGR